MNIGQILIQNDCDKFTNNFLYNLFPKLDIFEPEYQKEILSQDKFQEKSDYFIDQKFNLEKIIESSPPEETPKSQSKNITDVNSSTSEENSKNKAKNCPIFQTDSNNENETQLHKRFQDKLLMNRISARKSRLKKKQYIKCLEEEAARLKNQMILNEINDINQNNNIQNLNINLKYNNEKNKIFLQKITLLDNQKIEVKSKGQKKNSGVIKQYDVLRKAILSELLVKQIHLFIPLRYQIFGDKFIKLIQIDEDDSLSVINAKIDENIMKIKDYMNIVPKKRIKLVIKFFEIYKKIRNYVDNYQQLFTESFKY